MKGRRTDLSGAECAAARALAVIGDWWSLLIVRDALMGTERFSDFQKSIGLAKNILSSRLKKLVDDGVLELERDPVFENRHRYALTSKGESLGVVIAALWQWGEANCFEPGELSIRLVDGRDGQSFSKIRLRNTKGEPVESRGMRLRVKKKA
ncbi:MAG TPA: helix-turn-helix domain-containing protein [Gemmatimonadaceae bacterium]